MPEALSATDQLRKKRLIFTVSTGRSGTAYLSTVFGYARKTHSFHEPPPEYVQVLRDAQNDPKLACSFLTEKKIPAVLADQAEIYVETSHLTCKGFLEAWLELGIVPDLIIHRRPHRDVALSMYRMGTVPARSDKGLKFYLSPSDPGVLHLPDWQHLHDYQLCYWYCLEIERRAGVYKKLFGEKGARVTETTLGGLKSFIGLTHCFSDLDLQLKFPAWLTRLRFVKNTGVKVNESGETKKDIALPEDISALEQEVISRTDTEALRKILPAMKEKIG